MSVFTMYRNYVAYQKCHLNKLFVTCFRKISNKTCCRLRVVQNTKIYNLKMSKSVLLGICNMLPLKWEKYAQLFHLLNGLLRCIKDQQGSVWSQHLIFQVNCRTDETVKEIENSSIDNILFFPHQSISNVKFYLLF